MDIITAITTALSTLKTGYEIKKLAGNLDSEVQQSELRIEIRKLQESLIEVQDVLLNAKNEILQNRESIQEKDKKIVELEGLLAFKEQIIFYKGAYYKTNENGNAEGEPYCSRCWDYEEKKVHLFKLGKDFFECPQCKYPFGVSQGIY
jgi:hypothetical protein